MATPQDQLESLFDPPSPPSALRPRASRTPKPDGGIERLFDEPRASSGSSVALRPAPAAHPHGAFDSLTSGSWSLKRGDDVKGWYRQTYGRDLPVTAEGQSGTHNRMGLDHSDALDVGINPTTEEGKALSTYLRANNLPFLAYDRAVPGAATAAHFHIGFPSRRGQAGEAARLGAVDGLFDSPIDGLFDGEEAGDVVTVNASASAPSSPLQPLRQRETFDPRTEEGRRLRDESARLERTPGAFLEVAMPLPLEEKLSNVEAGGEMVRGAYVRALVARGVPEPEAVKLVGSGYSLRNMPDGPAVAPADAFTDDALDAAARTLRVRLDPNHVSKLVDDYRTGRGALTRVQDWATDEEHSPGEKLLDVATPVVQKGARAADLATRPLQAIDAAFWSKARGVDNVAALKTAYDQFFGEQPELGKNLIAEALKDSDRLRAINPRLPVLLGELANLVLQPSNVIPVGAVAKGAKALRVGSEAGRVGRLLEGVGDVAREVGVLDRGIVNPRPLGLADDALEAGARSVASVPEAVETLAAQFNSALSAESPRAAVLITPGESVPGRTPPGFSRYLYDEGTLFINDEKAAALGLDSPQKLRAYIDREGFEPLIGKVSTPEEVNAWLRGARPSERAGSVDHLFDPPAPAHYSSRQPRTPAGKFDGPPAPEPRSASEVAEGIRVTHARERADFYAREAASAKDPVHRAEAEQLARQYGDEAAEARVSDVANRVRRGELVAPEEMADLERAVLAEDGTPVYTEVEMFSRSAAAPSEPAGRGLLGKALDAVDATKSTFASADVSAIGRQAFLPFLFDSRATAGALKRGLGAATPAGQSGFVRWLDSHPQAKMWRDFGLQLNTLTGAPNEFFTSKLAEKIPGYGRLVIKPSDRVMTAQLDAVRLAVAESWGDDLMKAGLTPESAPEEWQAVARFINTASGRAELGQVGQAIYPVTRRVIFSPKLLKSRFSVINPLTYARMPPATRKIAAKKLGKAAAKMAPVLGLAYLTADEVGLNPFKGNFGLARYGNTTYDLTGGLGSKLRFVFQIAHAAGATADAYRKGESVEYKDTPWGVGLHFLRSQLAPSYSIIPDAVTGETFDKKEFIWTEGALRRLSPGFAQDVLEGFTEGDGLVGAAKALPSFVGVSSRTRDREELKREWASARAASKKAQAVERTADVMKSAPAEVRNELQRLRIYLPESDAAIADRITEAVARAKSGPGWRGLTDKGRKVFLENVIAGVRKESSLPSAARAERAERAKEGERIQLTGAAAEAVERLDIVVDPLSAGHRVGTMSGESVGFRGEHLGQTPEMLVEYRRRLAEETQAEVERVMSFRDFDSQPDEVKRGALQAAVDRVKTRLGGEFNFGTRQRDYGERERLERYQRELESRTPRLKPGETLKLGEEGSGPVSQVEPAHEEIRRAVDEADPDAEPTFREFPEEMSESRVPRTSMPQIRQQHRGALVQFLKARGITHEQVEIDPRTLKPSQRDYSPEKVAKAKTFDGPDRSILISSDGYVLDGHHGWLSRIDDESIPAIRLNAPIQQLLLEAVRFPSSGVDDASA